eukprot:6198402-Pleurochrysis_carterae.AAC.1
MVTCVHPSVRIPVCYASAHAPAGCTHAHASVSVLVLWRWVLPFTCGPASNHVHVRLFAFVRTRASVLTHKRSLDSSARM